MQQQLLTKIAVYYNGALLTREADVTINHHSGLNQAFSIGGIAVSQGVPFITFDVSNVVPISGFEQSTEADQQAGNVVEVTFKQDNGVTLTTDCWIMNSDVSYGVNKETMYKFSGFGEAATWM